MIRERPNCRKVIEKMMKEYNCDLQSIYVEHVGELSQGLFQQVKLMMLELKDQEGDGKL